MNALNKLISLAAREGMYPGTVRDILNLIDAHPDLIDYPRIITGLMRVLEAADMSPVLEIQGRDPTVWHEVCEWIVSLKNKPNITEELGERFWLGDEGASRNPVKNQGGGVKIFGFPYAVLWAKPQDPENAYDYYRFCAQLLLAFQRYKNVDDLTAQRYELYRLLERLSGTVNLYIPDQLHIWGTHSVFVASCQELEPRHLKKIREEPFAAATRTVRYFAGKRPADRSGGGGRSGRRVKPVTVIAHEVAEDPRGFVLADPDDPDQLPGYYEITSVPVWEQDDAPEPDEVAPYELTPATEIWMLDDDGLDRPYVENLLSAQNVEAHIIRSRQMLPFEYNLLTLKELQNLLFGVGDLFESCVQQVHSTSGSSAPNMAALQLKMEAVLLIHLALWLGQPMAQISQMVVSDHESECADYSLSFIRGTPSQDRFRLLVRSPRLVGDGLDQAQSGTRDAVTHVLLPDLTGSGALINTLLNIFPRKSRMVFVNKADALEAEARVLFREIGQGDVRYTLIKVRKYLHAQIYHDTGDIAVAGMLSGIVNPSAETPLYYLQMNANYLCAVYVRSMEKVLGQIYACAGLQYEPIELYIEQDGAVGATHCLLPETVAGNFKALKTVFSKQPRGSLRELLDWHNAYTLWTVKMFMMATGCRAIRNPLRHVDELDSTLLRGALSDKDAADRHMSRLICLPEMLKKQLTAYAQHCDDVARQLTGYLVAESAAEEWQRGFFLRLAGSQVRRDPIRPGVMMQVMQQIPGYTPHRANALRKYVRSELAEAGCPGQVLAAYMGHWLRGEEPQDRYSSFCPATYAKVLEQFLGPLLRDGRLSFKRSAKRAG